MPARKRHLGPKIASVTEVPDVTWARVLKNTSSLVLHHPKCDSLDNKACDCKILTMGRLLTMTGLRVVA